MPILKATTHLHKAAAEHINIPKNVCFVRLQRKLSLSTFESKELSINSQCG